MELGNISGMTDYTSSLASAQNTEKLAGKARSAQTEDEMLDACKEFETYLWEQVIKSMKKTTKAFSGEDEESGTEVGLFMDTAITEVAGKLTEQNLGPNSLAMQMYEQMKRNQGVSLSELMAAEEQGRVQTAEEVAETLVSAEDTEQV